MQRLKGSLVGKTDTSRSYRVNNPSLTKKELEKEIRGCNRRISTLLRNTKDTYNTRVSLANAYKLLKRYKELMNGL